MGTLAELLRSLRQDAGMTQEEVAEAAGLSVRTISDIERGIRTRLYRDTAVRLGSALRLSDAALVEFVDYARGRTASFRRDLDEAFRRRFVAWHVDRISSLSQNIGSEEAWYAVLDADEANLAVALRWAAEDGDTESLLLLGTGLFRYWQARGDLAVGRKWLERGLRTVPEATPPTRMSALWALGWLAFQQGDETSTQACARELAALAATSADPIARRNAVTLDGLVALAHEDVDMAVRQFVEAVDLVRDAGEPWLSASSLLNLAMATIASGRTSEARSLLHEALRMYDDLGDERFRARALGYLGLAALVDGEAGRAEALYAQSLRIFDALGEPKGVAEALTGLASAAVLGGAVTRSAQLGGAAERLRESFGGCALPVERRLAHAQFAMVSSHGGQRWRDEWTRGRAFRTTEAVETALGRTSR